MESIEHLPLDFNNAVELMARPEVEKKPLLPLFEAIHNSIQSIEIANRSRGEVSVNIVRDQEDMDPKRILEITITDNGIGFNKDNVLSFGKLFTTCKKEKFNSKGVGRLAFFVPFYCVEIESIYEDNGKCYLFSDTITENNFYKIPSFVPAEIERSDPITKITLTKMNPNFFQMYKIEQNYLKSEVTQHFLPSTLSDKNIKIKIDDEEEYFLDDSVQDVFHDKPILIESSVFDIYHLKNRSPYKAKHKIILSADGRSVKEEVIGFLPKGKIGTGDDRFYLNTVVISDFLNEKLNTQRTDFNIPKTKSSLNGAIDMETIYERVLGSSRSYSHDSIARFENVLDKFIEKTFDDLPHLSFLREDKEVRKNLKLGDDAKTVKEAFVKRFAEKQAESLNYVKVIAKKYEKNSIPNFEEFQEGAQKKLEEGMKVNHASLVTYISYRDFVLRLYDKLLEKKEDGNYQPEKILHDLLFPTKTSSNDYKSDYFKHNLWIIDDRYAMYDFLTSDLPEYAASGATYDPKDKRYDICAAYSDPIGEEHNIFIVELKKTSLPLSESNDPIAQIKNYVQRMMNGKFAKYNGTRINISNSTQFFGLVLCDVHSEYFLDFMVNGHSLKKRPDAKSYHAVMLNDRLFLEVTNYENLLDIAHARNRVFIEKLKYR
jgi:hypothetical protein